MLVLITFVLTVALRKRKKDNSGNCAQQRKSFDNKLSVIYDEVNLYQLQASNEILVRENCAYGQTSIL